MRKALIASVAIVPLMAPLDAFPQIPVTDGAHLLATELGFSKELVQIVEQLGVMKQQYEAAVAQLGTMIRTVEAGPRALASGIGALNPMPEVRQLTSMASGFTNGRNPLDGMIRQVLNGNGLALRAPINAFDRGTSIFNRGAYSAASVSALANQQLSSLEQHISGIDEMREQLSGSNFVTQADLLALQARLQAEQAALQAQNTQMAALQMTFQAQQEASRLAREQAVKDSGAQMFRASSSGGGPATGGPPSAVAGGTPTVTVEQLNALPANFSTVP